MKNSNKLLLGGFLTMLLLIAAVHVALYAKYKNGSYTIYRPGADAKPQPLRSFPGIKYVSLHNVSHATVYLSDETAVERNVDSAVKYSQKGDSLLITGRGGDNHSKEEIVFHLSYNALLSISNSFVDVKKASGTAERNAAIQLERSHITFLGIDNDVRLGHVKITAKDQSLTTINQNIFIDNLEVQVFNSALETKGGTIDHLLITTDSISTISLQSNHLLKAKINSFQD